MTVDIKKNINLIGLIFNLFLLFLQLQCKNGKKFNVKKIWTISAKEMPIITDLNTDTDFYVGSPDYRTLIGMFNSKH